MVYHLRARRIQYSALRVQRRLVRLRRIVRVQYDLSRSAERVVLILLSVAVRSSRYVVPAFEVVSRFRYFRRRHRISYRLVLLFASRSAVAVIVHPVRVYLDTRFHRDVRSVRVSHADHVRSRSL